MFDIIIQLLKEFGVEPGFFRLFQYLTFRAMMSMATSVALSLFSGFYFIIFLYRKRLRDTSGNLLSINTASKAGTPTAGGIMIIVTTLVSSLLWNNLSNSFVHCLLAALIYFGLVGFFDDWQKVKYKSSLLGLSQKMKTILMLVFIVPFAIYFVSVLSPVPQELKTKLFIPFYKHPLFDLGNMGYGMFIVFVFFSVVNSVNISDGQDGLLSGTSLMTLGVYAIFAYIIGNKVLSEHYLFYYVPDIGEVAVFIGALAGGILGFLWYNGYPAEVFMGDTGALSIGSVMALILFFTKQEFLFLIAGGVFVFEVFSSFIQEKIGNRMGKRFFYRAPFHHSLTHSGLAEPKAVLRIWILSLLMSFIALLSIKIR